MKSKMQNELCLAFTGQDSSENVKMEAYNLQFVWLERDAFKIPKTPRDIVALWEIVEHNPV